MKIFSFLPSQPKFPVAKAVKPALCYATLKEGIMQKQNDESKDDFENLALVFHSV